MPELSFQYPAWFLVLCVLLGLGYASLLYYRDITFVEKPLIFRRILFVLRWLVVTLISTLLLSPLLKRTIIDVRKPVIALLQDQSESVGSELNGAILDVYKQDWQQLRAGLSDRYDIQELSFGDQVRDSVDFEFRDKVTNLSEVLQEVYDRFGAQNLGAIVLATDGIYNEGSNPVYAKGALNVPVYTVALGDTTPKKDLFLKRVFHNNIVYLGDRFMLQVDIAATNCAGSQTVLTIGRRDGDRVEPLQSIPVSISGKDFFVTKTVELETVRPGVAQYVVSLSTVSGEVSTVNNSREVFVDVLDARQKILLLANSPHPDITALRQMLELNKNYAVTVGYSTNAGLDVSKFDFVILHNLPSRSNDLAGVLRVMDDRRIPRLFIAGMQTNFNALTQVQGLLVAQSDGGQSDDVQGIVSKQFASFRLEDKLVSELPKFNPVVSPFGNFNETPIAQVVLRKRIGKVDTDQPLLLVGEENGIKTGVFVGEGLWKWRMFDFLQHQNQDVFDELMGKTVQYLSIKEDKRKFRVSLEKTVFNENEQVLFAAELYNDNYELTNEPDVSISVRHTDGREFVYTFNKLGKAYALDAGILPVGNYTYKASTSFNGQSLQYEGRFSVRPLQLEFFATTANHGLLHQLSDQSGGASVGVSGLKLLSELIQQKSTIKPIIFETNETSPLVNIKWIFALLAGLLTLEWFLRRYFGAY
jgi:hypothetical protein